MKSKTSSEASSGVMLSLKTRLRKQAAEDSVSSGAPVSQDTGFFSSFVLLLRFAVEIIFRSFMALDGGKKTSKPLISTL